MLYLYIKEINHFYCSEKTSNLLIKKKNDRKETILGNNISLSTGHKHMIYRESK